MSDLKSNKGLITERLGDGEPCIHSGCLSHISHPCEMCGRIAGYSRIKIFEDLDLIYYFAGSLYLKAFKDCAIEKHIKMSDSEKSLCRYILKLQAEIECLKHNCKAKDETLNTAYINSQNIIKQLQEENEMQNNFIDGILKACGKEEFVNKPMLKKMLAKLWKK